MASKQKERRVWVCQSCGSVHAKWAGRCDSCGEWSTLVESIQRAAAARAATRESVARPIDEIDTSPADRMSTGLPEVDRVLGGGLVKGSLVLLSGDPGIGKSTLMLQVAGGLERQGCRVLYASGEESAPQVKLRGARLGLTGPELYLLAEREMEAIESELLRLQPQVLVLDSIQTVYSPQMMSPPGSIAQVRESTNRLMTLAKEHAVACLVVGHITKDGAIAGPKSLEHIVDVVLYFEGDRLRANRILRVQKNRFGSISEICLFTMEPRGLQPVENPSRALLRERPASASGSVVACCVEGTQPICFEVQALVSSGVPGNPRRMTAGLDHNRVAMLLAVMEKRLGCHLGGEDVFINIPGGLYVDDPGLDLPVVTAVWSSLRRRPVTSSTGVFGEIGLAGEIRGVASSDQRIAEAMALGLTRLILPAANVPATRATDCEIIACRTLKEALEHVLAS